MFRNVRKPAAGASNPSQSANEQKYDPKDRDGFIHYISTVIAGDDIENFHEILLNPDFDVALLKDEKVTPLLEKASQEIYRMAEYRIKRDSVVKEKFKLVTRQNPSKLVKDFYTIIDKIKKSTPSPTSNLETADLFKSLQPKDLKDLSYMLDEEGNSIINYALHHNPDIARGFIRTLYNKGIGNQFIKDLFSECVVDSYSKVGGYNLIFSCLIMSIMTTEFKDVIRYAQDPAMFVSQFGRSDNLLYLIASRYYEYDPAKFHSSKAQEFIEHSHDFFVALLHEFTRRELKKRENAKLLSSSIEQEILTRMVFGANADLLSLALKADKEKREFNFFPHIMEAAFLSASELKKHYKSEDNVNVSLAFSTSMVAERPSIMKRRFVDNFNRIIALLAIEAKERGVQIGGEKENVLFIDVLEALVRNNMRDAIDSLLNNCYSDCVLMFKNSPKTEDKIKQKSNLIFHACTHNNATLASFLVKQGINPYVNIAEREFAGKSLLQYAIAKNCSAEFVDALLTNYSNQYAKNHTSIIEDCLREQKLDVAMALIKKFYRQHPADFILEVEEGKIAIASGLKEILKEAILQNNILLQEAIEQGNLRVVRFFLENNPNLNLDLIYNFVLDRTPANKIMTMLDSYQSRIEESGALEDNKFLPAFTAQDYVSPMIIPPMIREIVKAIQKKGEIKAEALKVQAIEKIEAARKSLLAAKKIKAREAKDRKAQEDRERKVYKKRSAQETAERMEKWRSELDKIIKKSATEQKKIEEEQRELQKMQSKESELKKHKDAARPPKEVQKLEILRQEMAEDLALVPPRNQGKGKESKYFLSKQLEIERQEREAKSAEIAEKLRKSRAKLTKEQLKDIRRKIEESALALEKSKERFEKLVALGAKFSFLLSEDTASQADSASETDEFEIASDAESVSADSLGAASFQAVLDSTRSKMENPEEEDTYRALQEMYCTNNLEQTTELHNLQSDITNHFAKALEAQIPIIVKGSELYKIFYKRRHAKPRIEPNDCDLEIPISLSSRPGLSEIFNPALTSSLQERLQKIFGFEIKKENIFAYQPETHESLRNINFEVVINDKKYDIVVVNQDLAEKEQKERPDPAKGWISSLDAVRFLITGKDQFNRLYFCKEFGQVLQEMKSRELTTNETDSEEKKGAIACINQFLTSIEKTESEAENNYKERVTKEYLKTLEEGRLVFNEKNHKQFNYLQRKVVSPENFLDFNNSREKAPSPSASGVTAADRVAANTLGLDSASIA